MAFDDYTQGVLSKLGMDSRGPSGFVTPALLAFMRGVGMTLSSAEDRRANARNSAEQDYQRNSADTERRFDESKRNMTSSMVSRGILQSGEAGTRYSESDQDRARAQNDVSTARANRLTAVDQAYTDVADQLRQGTTERFLAAEQDEANRRATEAAQKRQQDDMTRYYQGMYR